MKKLILKTTILVGALWLFALPANALYYSASAANTMTSLNWYRGNIIASPASTWGLTAGNNGASLTWVSYLPQQYYSMVGYNGGSFAIRDTTRDIITFVSPFKGWGCPLGDVFRRSCDEGGSSTGVAPVPEPCTLILLGSGLGGVLLYRRRKAT